MAKKEIRNGKQEAQSEKNAIQGMGQTKALPKNYASPICKQATRLMLNNCCNFGL